MQSDLAACKYAGENLGAANRDAVDVLYLFVLF